MWDNKLKIEYEQKQILESEHENVIFLIRIILSLRLFVSFKNGEKSDVLTLFAELSKLMVQEGYNQFYYYRFYDILRYAVNHFVVVIPWLLTPDIISDNQVLWWILSNWFMLEDRSGIHQNDERHEVRENSEHWQIFAYGSDAFCTFVRPC